MAKERIVGKAGRTGLRTELGGFKKTPLDQAAQDCINQAAEFIAKKMEEFPFEGSVIKVANNGQVIMNRGAEFGVEAGQESEEEELLTDPDTGAILGKEEGEIIRILRVAKVDAKMSYCDVVSGEQKPEPGTAVRVK